MPTDVVVQAVEGDDAFYHQHSNRDGSQRKDSNFRAMRFSGEERPANTAYGYHEKFSRYLDGWEILEGDA